MWVDGIFLFSSPSSNFPRFPTSPRTPHSEQRSALRVPFHHVGQLSELITILFCCLSACRSCLNHLLTRKESCRLFVHYYVLKQSVKSKIGVLKVCSKTCVFLQMCFLSFPRVVDYQSKNKTLICLFSRSQICSRSIFRHLQFCLIIKL